MAGDHENLSVVRSSLDEILRACNLADGNSYSIESLAGDGSDRLFYRILFAGGASYLMVFPGVQSSVSTGEAQSCHLIGSHLAERQVSVPLIYFYDPHSGGIVYEDLGNLLLHDVVTEYRLASRGAQEDSETVPPALERYYQLSLDALIDLQINGASDFKDEYCWQGTRYDKDLILDKETGYFLKSYCLDFLGLSGLSDELQSEFCTLADRALREPAQFLLHRDYQSRNVMIHCDRVRIIDFQGARFGPLAYDVASLLNDPYVNLPHGFRKSLLEYYITSVQGRIVFERDCFLEGYYHIALLRNLQVLGAFAFLSKVRGKIFFRQYLEPAVHDLSYKLSGTLGREYPVLKELVYQIHLIQRP